MPAIYPDRKKYRNKRGMDMFHNSEDSFSPQRVDGLVCWFSADKIVNAASNTALDVWHDISGFGRNASQATAGQRPVFNTGVVNGMPAVTFDGSNDYMSTPNFTFGTQYSVFAVARSSTGSGGQWIVDLDTGSTRLAQILVGRGASNFNTAIFNTASATVTETEPYTLGNWAVFGMLRLAGSAQNYINGVSNGPTAIAGTDTQGQIAIGLGSDNTATVLNGDIAEVIIYSRQVNPSEQTMIQQYLGAKYGISVT